MNAYEPRSSGPSSEGKWIPSLLTLLTLGTRSVPVVGGPVHWGMLSNVLDPLTRCWWQASYRQRWLKNVPCTQSCLTLCDLMDCSPPGSSVRGILQAILEWVAISSSRGSFRPRDRTCVSHTAGGFFTDGATGEATSVSLRPRSTGLVAVDFIHQYHASPCPSFGNRWKAVLCPSEAQNKARLQKLKDPWLMQSFIVAFPY